MPTLQGKVALVTGSGRGIGQAIARRAAFGARVALARHVCQVLKGARTIVQGPNTHAYVCAEGTPALGVAGTGDVLAGVIAAALASKDSTAKSRIDRVCEAVLAHALAGVRAAEGRDRGLFASEVADAVSHVLAPRIRTF